MGATFLATRKLQLKKNKGRRSLQGFVHYPPSYLRLLRVIMSKIINFAKEKAKRVKTRSKNSILEFLQDAGVQIENVQVNVDQDDEIEIFFEPEDKNDS